MGGGRTDRNRHAHAVPPAARLVREALRSPSGTHDAATRTRLAPLLGHDLARLRVHEGPAPTAAAAALGARAFAFGRDVVLGAAATRSPESRRRAVSHEAVHSLQQGLADPSPAAVPRVLHDASAEREANAVADRMDRTPRAAPAPAATTRVAPALQFDLEDPGRLAEVHRSLFTAAPGGSAASRQPWRDARGSDRGTAGTIVEQARRAVLALVRSDPSSVGGTIEPRTTESALDADALAIDAHIRRRFPVIPASSAPDAVTRAVSVMGPGLTGDREYLHQWLANQLIGWTDIERFEIAETDPRFVAMLDELLRDRDIGDHLRVLASRVAGFQRGEGGSREVFVHRGTPAAVRRVVLIHEIVHFHAHPRYREWVDSTTDPRFYNEGYTEWLAQRAMTDEERRDRGSYAERVRAIEQQVAAHVSEDDMVRAFFAGEVWRIETRSTVARREFAASTGIAAAATPREEGAGSRSGPGLNQEVARGAHYRFLNLGRDQAEPKPEHVSYFREVKTRHLDTASGARVQFVGHASTTGSLEHNRDLSRRRALAFYRLARREGLPESRLVEPTRPAHFGETRPTLAEEDPATRAFNRRVELFIRSRDADTRRADEEAERP